MMEYKLHPLAVDESFSDLEHAELVRAIQAGSEAAAHALHRRFSKGLRWFLMKKTGRPDVEDEIQEVFAAVLNAIRSGALHDPQRLPGYIRTIASRMAVQRVRDIVRDRNVLQRLDEPADLDVPCTNLTPEAAAIQNERIAIARQVIANLKARDREILKRFYLDGQSKEEICHDMGLSETQFRLRKSRVKARVVEAFQRKEAASSVQSLATCLQMKLAC